MPANRVGGAPNTCDELQRYILSARPITALDLVWQLHRSTSHMPTLELVRQGISYSLNNLPGLSSNSAA